MPGVRMDIPVRAQVENSFQADIFVPGYSTNMIGSCRSPSRMTAAHENGLELNVELEVFAVYGQRDIAPAPGRAGSHYRFFAERMKEERPDA